MEPLPRGGRTAMREAAREARREQTPAEYALWMMVRDHRCGGQHFRRQKILGPFRVDFYCAAARLVVEVDGDVHREPDVARRDAERQRLLEQEFGVRFLRVANDEVLARPDQTRQRILRALESPSPAPPPEDRERGSEGAGLEGTDEDTSALP